MNSGYVYTTGSGMTEACICRCKFELPSWDTIQQYSYSNEELSMAGYGDAEQVYRWCWAPSCGMYTAGNVRIWQKLLHVCLHWEQSFLRLQRRGTFGDCPSALRPCALGRPRSCPLLKLPPNYSELKQDYSKVLRFISTICIPAPHPLSYLDITMGNVIKIPQWTSAKYTGTKSRSNTMVHKHRYKLLFGSFCCVSFYV